MQAAGIINAIAISPLNTEEGSIRVFGVFLLLHIRVKKRYFLFLINIGIEIIV